MINLNSFNHDIQLESKFWRLEFFSKLMGPGVKLVRRGSSLIEAAVQGRALDLCFKHCSLLRRRPSVFATVSGVKKTALLALKEQCPKVRELSNRCGLVWSLLTPSRFNFRISRFHGFHTFAVQQKDVSCMLPC